VEVRTPLKVTLERLPESRVQLDIEVDQERVDRQYETAYKRLSSQARIPGFRPGKAPRQLVERHLGRDRIMADVLDKLVPDVYNEVLETEPFDPVDQPSLDKVDLDPVRLTFTVPVRPTVELGDYMSIRVDPQPVEVTDEEIDEQIQAIRRRHATHVPVERAVQWGDILTANVTGVAEDDEFIGDKDVEFPLREGREIILPGIAEAFVGMEKGETKTLDLEIPEDFQLERIRGKKATFTLELTGVKEEQLPPEDDELAGLVNAEEFDSFEALKERIRTDTLAARQGEEDQRFRSAAIDQLVAGATLEYPEVMVEHEIDHVIRDVTGTEASQYISQLQRIGRSEADFKAQFRDAAAERLKRGLVLAKLTEVEHIEATPDDVEAEINRLVAPMGEEDGKRFRELFTSLEGLDSIRRNIVSQRTMERLATIARGEATASETAEAESPKEDSE
jgi:trigger factor